MAALAAGALALLAAFAVDGREGGDKHGTGLAPADPAKYMKYRAVSRHRAFLPDKVDLTANFPPPGDQEWQGACAAWATGYAARSFFTGKELGRPPAASTELASPAYIYYRIRKKKDSCTDPTAIADALDLLTNEGSVSLADMSYGTMMCRQAPPPELISKAAAWRIGGWRAVQHEIPDDWRSPIVMDDVKGQLAAGLPIVFAMTVTPEFKNWSGPGVYNTTSTAGGGHAMTLVGYDEGRQAFRVMNSWGRYWGDGGYIWVGYDTFKLLVREAYVLEPPPQDEPQAPPPAPPTLQGAVGKLECGRATISNRDGKTFVDGFGGSADSIEAARREALAADPGVVWNVVNRPWPQCEAELTLDNALKDRGPEVRLATESGARLSGDPAVMKNDELFSVEIETTAARPYMHLIYLQADGSAIEIYRGAPAPDASGRRVVRLGASGKTQQRFQVAPPFGDEELVLVASDAPVFANELAGQKTERQFLTILRSRLVAAQQAGRPVAADLQRIRTTAG